MKAFHAKRLLKLADFLDKLPKAKFDFSQIAYRGDKSMLEALRATRARCGTVACAIGWMPAVFPKLTAWVSDSDRDAADISLIVGLRGDNSSYATISSFETAQVVFGLSQEESEFLFAPFGHDFDKDENNHLAYDATPKQIARHIRKFVRDKQAEAAK